MKLVNKNARAKLIVSKLVFCVMIVFFYSCGGGGGGSDPSETGSVSFNLALQNSGTIRALGNRQLDDNISPIDCETHQIATIEAQVVDENEELLVEGGPFDCGAHQGTITGVEQGDFRVVKIFAKDVNGSELFSGESEPEPVIAGQTNDFGTILLGCSIISGFPPFSPDESDATPLNVIQTVPNDGDISVPPTTNIQIFFDDEIDPSTINDFSIFVKDSSGNRQCGTYSGELSEAGNTILFFAPFNSLPEDDTITVTLEQENGITDGGGNTLSSTFSFSFQTTSQLNPTADLSFELGGEGWSFSGDGDIVSTFGDIVPIDGSRMAGISTENQFGNTANSSTTSTLTSGPIDVPSSAVSLSFQYDFISEEFDEFVGTEFDDSFTVNIIGPNDSISEVVTSVNQVGTEASIPVNLPGMDDADHTDWTVKSIDIQGLGSPITISFTVTDVGDEVVDSVVLVDDLNFD